MVGKIIIFSGIDGSGKSMHACKLAHELRSCGRSVKCLWMRGRGRSFLSFPLLALCRLLGVIKVHRLNSGVRVSEYPFYAYRPLRLLWPLLQLVDSILYSVILVYSPLMRSYDITIMDRSVIDTLVDTIADTHAPTSVQLLHRLFLALLPKNSLVVMLDTSEEAAMNRKKDIPDIHYLKIRRRIYKHLAERYKWYTVATKVEFKTVHDLLMKLIEKGLKDS